MKIFALILFVALLAIPPCKAGGTITINGKVSPNLSLSDSPSGNSRTYIDRLPATAKTTTRFHVNSNVLHWCVKAKATVEGLPPGMTPEMVLANISIVCPSTDSTASTGPTTLDKLLTSTKLLDGIAPTPDTAEQIVVSYTQLKSQDLPASVSVTVTYTIDTNK